MRSPWPSSSAAIIRVVDDLPFDPVTWIARKRSCGDPSAVIRRRIRSSPKRIPNISSESRYSSARDRALSGTTKGLRLVGPARPARPRSARACRARPGRARAAPSRVNPSFESLPRARSISPRRRARSASTRARASAGSTVSPASTSTVAPSSAIVLDDVGVAAVRGDVEPREAADRVERLAIPVADDPRGDARRRPGRRPSRGSCAAAAPPRSPPPTSRSASSSISDASASGNGDTARSRSAPGMNEWISSVTNGRIGCASAIVCPSTYSSVADTSSSSS